MIPAGSLLPIVSWRDPRGQGHGHLRVLLPHGLASYPVFYHPLIYVNMSLCGIFIKFL